MENKNETEKPILLSRRGIEKHAVNPFLEVADDNTKTRRRTIINKTGDQMMVVDKKSGEVLGDGGAGFWQTQDVDSTQFVKLYVNGVRALKDLSSAGTKVFEILYMRVQEQFGKDVIYLSFQEVNQELTTISKSTFMRGMRELLEKDFIAETMTQGKYFLNPDFIWSGDRLAFVKEYRLANKNGSKKTANENQIDWVDEQK